MGLQEQVENFLSKASFIMFTPVDNDVVMYLCYEEPQFETFKDMANYKNLYDFYEGKEITLAVIEQPTYYRASLIDKNNGELINIDNAKFVTGNLDFLVNGVPTDKKMIFMIMCFMPKGERIMQPIIQGKAPLTINGYSYLYKK